MMCLCQSTDFVIPTEAKPSGGIWLQTKSKLGRNPDVSTESTPSTSSEPALSEVERAGHDKNRAVGLAPPLLEGEIRSRFKTAPNKTANPKTPN